LNPLYKINEVLAEELLIRMQYRIVNIKKSEMDIQMLEDIFKDKFNLKLPIVE